MKKIIILIICSFFLYGCYDYKEVNDLAFITALGIDYKDDEYEITAEILSGKSSGEKEVSTKTYNESAKGKNIIKAINNLSLKLSSYPYYYHLKALVISEDVAKTKVKDIIDFTTRSPEVRNEFYFIVAKDVSAKEIIKCTSENNPIVGETIMHMITNSTKVNSIAYEKMYEDNLKTFLNDGIDTITSAFTVKNDLITISGNALFDNFKLKDFLEDEDSSLLNSLITPKTNFNLTKNYDKDLFIINVYNVDSKISFKENIPQIDIDMKAEIELNSSSIDLKKEETYKKINKDFSKIAQKKYEKLLNKLKDLDIDPLGIDQTYYKKTRKKVDGLYKEDIKININLKINRNGLIYEVQDD